ncbi:substrate-binding domain-containing protein [Lignipirellula cremea]|uniref:Xylose operon regulatory protein n=1 Tax=Lignipirellula cremea TaxID=2528010 RepID=A0A518E4H2_9BACT|nr:substrate-binding domain-containing protein [Lignipirellula cremea]QDU98958.1 Xylose operon regulatory protein [Lignipirellula cremea]
MPQKPRRVALMLDLEWPYKRHASIFAGTQRYAEEQGWHSIIDEFAHDTLPAGGAKRVPYDGIIARANAQLVKRAARLGVPVVNVWLSSPAWRVVPGVFADFAVCGRLQAEHLLARGLRNFAVVVSFKNRGQELELREFRGVIEQKGYSCISTKVPQSLTRSLEHWRKTRDVISAWMDQWQLPIGVIVRGEDLGRLIVQMCHARGWRVPQDVAIIAGQNEETLCEFPRPSLTSMELGYERIGYESAKLLQSLMDGRKPPREPLLLPPQGLVVRESTDFFAVKDELVAAALEFISKNSHRHIGQDDVSRAVNAETRTLQLRFRKVLDRPIAAEIRRVRIERAKRELAQSKRRLSDIARDVGFGDAVRMYEVFRRELGVTPSEYRKQRQLKEEL